MNETQSAKRHRITVVNYLLVAFLSFVIVGCQDESESPGDSQGKGEIQTVRVATAVEDEVTDYVELVGRMTANEHVDIRSRVSGFLLKSHFDDGEQVKAGQLLFTIEPDQYEAINNQSLARVKVAEAEVSLAEKTFARSTKLLESNAVSRQEYEQDQAKVETARAQLTAAQADVERTKLNVSYTKIIAPVDGRVDRSLIDEGNYVTGGFTGGTVLTTVVNDRPIKATANVDENTILMFMRRQREIAGDDFQETNKVADLNIPCFLQLTDEEGFPHKGKVEYTEIQVNRGTGTSQMRSVFENENGLLKVGMFVRMRVPVTDPYQAVLVPDRAIGTDQATRFVYIVDKDNLIEQRQVEIGDRKGNLRVVKSGVKSGEVVLTAGLQLVQPGMEVKPEESENGDSKKKDDPENEQDEGSEEKE